MQDYRDDSLRARLAVAQRRASRLAEQGWERATAHVQAELDEISVEAEGVLEQFRPGLEEVAGALEAALAPLQDRLDELDGELNSIANCLELDLPDRPKGEWGSQGERSFLFDSNRDYLDQLAAYQAYKEGRAPPSSRAAS